MKKLILSSAVIIAALSANAQNKFGLQAGANFASVKSEYGSIKETSDSKVGFIVGGVADVDFGNSVSFRPELNFIQKGGKTNTTQTNSGFTTTDKSDLKLSYVQLAPNFTYNFEAGTGKFFIGVGPEFSFGIGGKSKEETTISGPGINTTKTQTVDVKFDGKKNASDNNVHLKGFDLGANAIAGYTLSNGAFVSAGYTLGTQNISPEDNSSVKNRGFNVKVGFLFGGSKK
jgi:hypothetical protein